VECLLAFQFKEKDEFEEDAGINKPINMTVMGGKSVARNLTMTQQPVSRGSVINHQHSPRQYSIHDPDSDTFRSFGSAALNAKGLSKAA